MLHHLSTQIIWYTFTNYTLPHYTHSMYQFMKMATQNHPYSPSWLNPTKPTLTPPSQPTRPDLPHPALLTLTYPILTYPALTHHIPTYPHPDPILTYPALTPTGLTRPNLTYFDTPIPWLDPALPNPSWHPTQPTLTHPTPTRPSSPCLLTQTCYFIYLKFDSD